MERLDKYSLHVSFLLFELATLVHHIHESCCDLLLFQLLYPVEITCVLKKLSTVLLHGLDLINANPRNQKENAVQQTESVLVEIVMEAGCSVVVTEKIRGCHVHLIM